MLLTNYFAVPCVQHQLGSNPCSQEYFLSPSYLPLFPHCSAPHGLSSILLLSTAEGAAPKGRGCSMCRSELEAPLKFPRAKEQGWNKMPQLSSFHLKLAE